MQPEGTTEWAARQQRDNADLLRRWDTGSLPLPCDLLVYSHQEWLTLPQWNPKLAAALLDHWPVLRGRPVRAARAR